MTATRFDRHYCFDGVDASPDLAARRLVMAALLYYEFSCNVMTDHEYDALGEFVRDHFEFIGPSMKFCIGEEWAKFDGLSWTASGADFKYTQRVFYAALKWAEHENLAVVGVRHWRAVDMDLETGIEYDVSGG